MSIHTVLTITSLVLDRMTEKQTVAESLEKRDIDFKKQFKKLSGN